MPCYAPTGCPSGRCIAEMFHRARDGYRVPQHPSAFTKAISQSEITPAQPVPTCASRTAEQPAPAILGLSIHSGSRTILPTADHPGRSGAVGTLQF